MGQILVFGEDDPISTQIKELDDGELLDFWEHTQQVENIIRAEFKQEISLTPDYEKIIIFELQLRHCQRKVKKMASVS